MATKYCGKDFVLFLEEPAASDTFVVFAGMRSTSITIANESVDVSNKDDNPWRQVLVGCGIRTMDISASGVFTDDITHDQANLIVTTDAERKYQIVSGRADEYQGTFQMTSLERAGEYNAEENYTISLVSTGTITYTPAP